jgi:hypothetical protein
MTVALARLDNGPSPPEWTNLVLEIGRLGPALENDMRAIEAVANAAFAVGRYEQWSSFLGLVAHLSGDSHVADAFAAVPPPPPAPPPPRSAYGRLTRLLSEYRADARARREPVTVRGLARFLARRWRVPSARDLPRETVRRVLRSR